MRARVDANADVSKRTAPSSPRQPLIPDGSNACNNGAAIRADHAFTVPLAAAPPATPPPSPPSCPEPSVVFIAVLPGFTKASFGSGQQSYYLVRAKQNWIIWPASWHAWFVAGRHKPPIRCLPRYQDSVLTSQHLAPARLSHVCRRWYHNRATQLEASWSPPVSQRSKTARRAA